VKIFSIPLNPKLNEKQSVDFINFCSEYKSHIYDIYFTCRIAPFLQDAMGDIFIQTEDNLSAIENALFISEKTGIPLSATFNNIEVRPTQKNLDTWIKNFRKLYDRGIRSITIPHTHWVLTGQIQSEFPGVFIKNTILRNVREPNEVANLAKAGFHYVNLDRDLMRDHNRLKEIKRVKDKFNIKLSLLGNEGCLGGCPVMDEHFQFNNGRTEGPQYFNDAISRVSCPKWDYTDSAIPLKTANFPPWREDWIEFLKLGIDVFKMHGRESVDRLYETFDIIKRFANDEEILFDNFNEYLEETKLKEKPINIWRNKIKTCKFDCWDCNYCDKVWLAKGNKVNEKISLVAKAVVDSINLPKINDIEGLTSDRTKKLLNALGKLSTSYLEIGVLNGATFCSVLKDNTLNAYAVDDWNHIVQAANGTTNIQSSKEKFISNVKKIKGNNKIKLFDSHFLNVDKSTIDYIDFMFYDADHSEELTRASVTYFSDKFTNNAILIFDDANFDGVVSGALKGIEDSGLKVLYQKIILNDIEDAEQWWNGLLIVVIGKD
jgi:hypothetical protein